MNTIKLPTIDQEQGLNGILSRRISIREFQEQALTDFQISQLLWACQGINRFERRTAPSAGALYPLEVYLVDKRNFSHYDPHTHALNVLRRADLRSDLAHAALDQDFIARAPVTFVLTAVYARVAGKYGATRSIRYTDMEVGHAAQNLLLQATAHDLAGVPVGAFNDAIVAGLLDLPGDHAPLYLVPVGYPGEKR